jgi:hypothetical protein
LVEIGFSIRRVFGRFASLLGQIPVAVLMAVRCQLSCILLLRIARKVAIATYSHQTVYATICERLRRAAKPQKTDSKSADPCGHGGSTPPPGTMLKLFENQLFTKLAERVCQICAKNVPNMCQRLSYRYH